MGERKLKKWDNPDGTRMECTRDGCSNPIKTAALCSKHYSRVQRGTDENTHLFRWIDPDGNRMECSRLNCTAPINARGLCKRHYQRSVQGLPPEPTRGATVHPDGSPKTCSVEDCTKPVLALGLCQTDYHRKWGIENGRVAKPLTYCPVDGCGRVKAYRSVICKRCNQFRWRFSLTVEATIESWKYENRHCTNPGCLSTESLHMDHDHSCCPAGKFPQSSKVSCGECVRGWLCHPCNTTLGQMQEDPRRIGGLLRYLNGERG